MGNINQSCYSIVERLTAKKLEIMEEKQRIEGDIEAKKVRIKQLTQEREEEWKIIKEDTDNSIDLLNQEIASLEKGKNTRAKLCDDKIVEIDNALMTIKSISDASVEQSKS